MAIKTATAEYEELQTAVEKILTKGQAWGASGQSLSRADLPTLYDRMDALWPRVQRESGGRSGIRTRGITPVDI